MYSDAEINDAVRAGVLPADMAEALRAHVAEQRQSPIGGEEHFRLITSFNDVFVTIAACLFLLAIGWQLSQWHWGAAWFLVAGASWGLAEYFTRVRRMAFPSIFLLGAFLLGVFGFSIYATAGFSLEPPPEPIDAIVAALITSLAAWFHWRRFRVPITVAAGAGALALAGFVALFENLDPELMMASELGRWFVFGAGTAIFAYAMWWDMSDVERRTRNNDTAFWLHLLAAPMIAHPVFSLASNGDEQTVLSSLGVVILYVLFGFVALAIDRRAFLVSATGYLIFAISSLARAADGAFGYLNAVTLSCLVVGGTMLCLGAFWKNMRSPVVAVLPRGLRARLPVNDR